MRAAGSSSPRTPKRPRAGQTASELGLQPSDDGGEPRQGVHMAVCAAGGRVGFAWYDPSTAEVRASPKLARPQAPCS